MSVHATIVTRVIKVHKHRDASTTRRRLSAFISSQHLLHVCERDGLRIRHLQKEESGAAEFGRKIFLRKLKWHAPEGQPRSGQGGGRDTFGWWRRAVERKMRVCDAAWMQLPP